MPKVPDYHLTPDKPVPVKGYYCFKLGATEPQKQQDIVEVNKFIDYIKAKHSKTKNI